VQVLFLQSHSTCFGRKRPSSGVFKTSTAATGTCVIVAGKSSHLLIRAGTALVFHLTYIMMDGNTKLKIMTKLIVVLRNFANRLKKQGIFLSIAPRSPIEHCFPEHYQFSPVCPSAKRKMCMKGVEYNWNETDRGKPKYSEKHLSQCHFFPPHITHGLRWDRIRAFALRGR